MNAVYMRIYVYINTFIYSRTGGEPGLVDRVLALHAGS